MSEQGNGLAEAGIGSAALVNYLTQLDPFPQCPVELYVGRVLPTHIERYRVVKLGPGTYRAAVLFRPGSPGRSALAGIDGSLSDVTRWLRVQGLPVLRVSGPPRS